MVCNPPFLSVRSGSFLRADRKQEELAHSLGDEENIDFAEIVLVKVGKSGMAVVRRMLTGIKLDTMSIYFLDARMVLAHHNRLAFVFDDMT